MAKKQIVREEPMNVGELLYTSNLAKMCGFRRENIINSRGLFPALRVISTTTFDKDEIKLIQKAFQKRFQRVLLFTERKDEDGNLSIGYFTKKA